MTSERSTFTYHCSYCSKQRLLKIDPVKHETLINNSPNGLRLFTDIHKCRQSQIEANNLSIDADFNVRSQELLKIPEYKVMNAYSIPVPSTKKNVDDLITIRITHLEHFDLHVRINHGPLQTTILIGDIYPEQKPLFSQTSTFEGITLEFFESKMVGGSYLKDWFQFFIDTVEILPPSHLGNLLEVLDYICERHMYPVQEFDKEFVRTILASHEVFVMLKQNENLQFLKDKLSPVLKHDDFELIDTYIKILTEMETSSVLHLLNVNAKNYIHQLYILLIMEKAGMLSIERPGIVNS